MCFTFKTRRKLSSSAEPDDQGGLTDPDCLLPNCKVKHEEKCLKLDPVRSELRQISVRCGFCQQR